VAAEGREIGRVEHAKSLTREEIHPAQNLLRGVLRVLPTRHHHTLHLRVIRLQNRLDVRVAKTRIIITTTTIIIAKTKRIANPILPTIHALLCQAVVPQEAPREVVAEGTTKTSTAHSRRVVVQAELLAGLHRPSTVEINVMYKMPTHIHGENSIHKIMQILSAPKSKRMREKGVQKVNLQVIETAVKFKIVALDRVQTNVIITIITMANDHTSVGERSEFIFFKKL
jgi:hypothetical protein